MTAFAGKRILVVGMGRSGVACARFLKDGGGRVTVTDSGDDAALGQAAALLRGIGVSVALGGHPTGLFADAELIVLSPGVPHTLAPLEDARKRGVPVMGEIELASRFVEAPMVAVTGTNGKTTTTTLIGRMLAASGLRTFVGGNIGTPLIEYVAGGDRCDRVVVEVSSFQLDTIERFHPSVGVLLNITPDHLDRYEDFNAYARSKGRVFENQGPSDVAVLNGADPAIEAISAGIRSRKWFFNPQQGGMDGAVIDGDAMTVDVQGAASRVVDLSRVGLMGRHNRENIAAATLAALAAGGTPSGVDAALKDFRGLPHRMTLAATIAGVRYIDDSKATNPDAVLRAIESFDGPVVLIMGGRDKGGGYASLRQAVKERVKSLVLIGEAQDAIARDLGDCCGHVARADSMAAAVAIARKSAESGDVVLLSPACSSFDMFASYAERGEVFCKSVAGLMEEG